MEKKRRYREKNRCRSALTPWIPSFSGSGYSSKTESGEVFCLSDSTSENIECETTVEFFSEGVSRAGSGLAMEVSLELRVAEAMSAFLSILPLEVIGRSGRNTHLSGMA
jgi:hypothetical protein